MAIPDYQSIMLPLLKLGADKQEHKMCDVTATLADQFDLSDEKRRVLRSYLDLNVLQKTGAKGVYSARATLEVDDLRLVAWLAEASLYARASGSAPLKDLIDSPSYLRSGSSRSMPKALWLRHPDSIFSATGWTTTSPCY